jgi:hypothetical protein
MCKIKTKTETRVGWEQEGKRTIEFESAVGGERMEGICAAAADCDHINRLIGTAIKQSNRQNGVRHA